MRLRTILLFAYALAIALVTPANAIETSEIEKAQTISPTVNKHLGVASCASSTCHGSTIAFADSNVLQNEFRTWNEQDPHSQAFKTLTNPQSKAIADNLGLESAQNAPVCLGCHSDNRVPAPMRGPDFALSDGVGCETCHGGAEQYLESHTNASHQDNLSAGLTALEKPLVRAQLCVSCHVGDSSERKITHEIMGAGHPRLSFEVNTFSSIQPAHFVADQDYTQRKGKPMAVQLWAIGQLVASEQILSNIAAFPRAGLFPELAHMDCLSCHQALGRVDWTPNPLTQLSPGSIRFNDAHLLTSYQLTQALAPDLAPDLLAKIRQFSHHSSLNQDSQALLNSLTEQLLLVRTRLLEQTTDSNQAKILLQNLVASGLKASHQGYASAEQSAMAINSVVLALNSTPDNAFDRTELLVGIDAMFKALDKPSDYKAAAFTDSLNIIKAAVSP